MIVFFDFPVEIRKIIYTANLIENLNGKIRKCTKKTNTYSIQMWQLYNLFIWFLEKHKNNGCSQLDAGT